MTRPLSLPDPPLTDLAAGIVLRPWDVRDAPALEDAWTDPDIARWTAVPAGRTLVDAERWIAGAQHRRDAGVALDLVIAGCDGVVRGEVGLVVTDDERRWAEVGYWAAPMWRGSGSTAPAVRVLTDWALGDPARAFARIYALVRPDNPGSEAVVRRAGFTTYGTVHDGQVLWAKAAADTVSV